MKKQFPEYGILYIDDEMKSLKYFEAIFEGLAPIYIANSPDEGFAVFQEHHDRIGVVMSDKKMPGESGIELLKRIRKVDPNPLRFLVTAFSDLDAAVDALNDGLLYSYLTKPWDPDDLEHRLSKALAHFCLERERERLIREKADAFQQLLMADKAASIGILSAGLNHHLRNALTVMRTFYDLLPFQLEDEIEGEPKDRAFWCDFYGEVGGQIDRMTSILSNLSEGTKMSGLRVSEGIDMATTMRDAGELVLQGRPDIRFKVEGAGRPSAHHRRFPETLANGPIPLRGGPVHPQTGWRDRGLSLGDRRRPRCADCFPRQRGSRAGSGPSASLRSLLRPCESARGTRNESHGLLSHRLPPRRHDSRGTFDRWTECGHLLPAGRTGRGGRRRDRGKSSSPLASRRLQQSRPPCRGGHSAIVISRGQGIR
jgi:CheY-like chemotaxis protein